MKHCLFFTILFRKYYVLFQSVKIRTPCSGTYNISGLQLQNVGDFKALPTLATHARTPTSKHPVAKRRVPVRVKTRKRSGQTTGDQNTHVISQKPRRVGFLSEIGEPSALRSRNDVLLLLSSSSSSSLLFAVEKRDADPPSSVRPGRFPRNETAEERENEKTHLGGGPSCETTLRRVRSRRREREGRRRRTMSPRTRNPIPRDTGRPSTIRPANLNRIRSTAGRPHGGDADV